MRASKKAVPKKRGRPATGKDPVTAIRLSVELRNRVDAWAADQADHPKRSEAIRRLVERALASAQPVARHSKKTAAHAHEIAAQTIDSIVDKSAPPQEQEKRKRRLLKGPEEFQDIRGQLSKPKR
jgi:hypothetical protein